VGATAFLARVPFSGSGPALFARFGASSTNVSPSSVFARSIALAPAGIGAYFASSSIVARVELSLSASSETTLPTVTPEMRTSACRVSCAAFGKSTLNRYPFGCSGTGPPNETQRKRSAPKLASAKMIIASSRGIVGIVLITWVRRSRCSCPQASAG
jgi:hypothetical protein